MVSEVWLSVSDGLLVVLQQMPTAVRLEPAVEVTVEAT